MQRQDIRRRVVPLAIALTFGAALVMSTVLYRMRIEMLERSREEAANLASVISGQVSRSVQGIEIVLDDLSVRVGAIRAQDPAGWLDAARKREMRDYFRERLLRLSNAEGIIVADPSGAAIPITNEAQCCRTLDISDRDYFRIPKSQSGSATFVSAPIQNRVSGKKVVFFSRRVEGRAGEFLGLVAIAYEPHHLIVGTEATAAYGRSIVLARQDGMILYNDAQPHLVGSSYQSHSLWVDAVKAGGGAYESPGFFDGKRRLVHARVLKEMPLVISAALFLDVALLSWWSITIGSVIAFGIIAVIFAALLRLLLRQLSEAEASENRLQVMAHQDQLTGLPNRAHFSSSLIRAMARVQRNRGEAAVMFIDLDRFKQVNDSLGHAAGDELLVLVAQRLNQALRKSDLLARVGGDEFIVLADDLTHPADAGLLAGRLIDLMCQPFRLKSGQDIYIGGSIGIAIFSSGHVTAEEIIQSADTALYAAKAAGGGVYKYYDKQLTAQANKRLDMDARMRRALANKEFVLHYQPIFDIGTRSIIGAEALVRWNDPIIGLVPPADFISLAETSGFIVQLGEWVAETACAQMAAWTRQGLDLSFIAINVSPRQFRQNGFVEQCADALKRTGVAPERVMFEITESALMDDNGPALEVLNAIRALGVNIAIDDFGTGYSCLAYLGRYPIDMIKIDGCFVRDGVEDPTSREIVSAILALAKSLKLDVIAEGIETEAQFAMLEGKATRFGQGYLISRPLTAVAFETFYKQKRTVAAMQRVAALT